jgi:hypothetical protein
MRTTLWEYILNSEGQPVEGAIVNLYDGDDIVNFYTSESGTIVVNNVVTDSNGFFQIWVEDKSDTIYGMATNTSYTLVISGGTFPVRTIDGIRLNFPSPKIFELSSPTSDLFVEQGSTGVYDITIEHKLNTDYPIIQVYNTETRSTIPFTATSDDENNVIVRVSGFSSNLSSLPVHITILGKDI